MLEERTVTQNEKLAELSAAGVSVWLDDLSRDLISSGQLQELVDTKSVVGVTTNPSIFQAALSKGTAYDDQINELAARDTDVDSAVRTLTTDDVRNACDVLRPVFDRTNGLDGRVSIEVDPRLAHDTQKTAAQAVELWKIVDRPNTLIKIPATKEGLPAISRTLAEGISVNVTLIFSVERYQEVIDAYLNGLDAALAAGHDISKIHSVASFFVSRVDTEIDARLDEIGTDEAKALKGKASLKEVKPSEADDDTVAIIYKPDPNGYVQGAAYPDHKMVFIKIPNAQYPEAVQGTIAHELGHMMGAGHSCAGALMAGSNQNPISYHVTPLDAAAIIQGQFD